MSWLNLFSERIRKLFFCLINLRSNYRLLCLLKQDVCVFKQEIEFQKQLHTRTISVVEESVKFRALSNKKIRIFLCINYVEFHSIYKGLYVLLEKDPFFEVYFFLLPQFSYGEAFMEYNYRRLFSYYSSANMKFIGGWENGEFIDIYSLKPDLVFYVTPISANFHPLQRATYVSNFSLVCFIPYGFLSADSDEYHYNSDIHAVCWRVFCETPFHFDKNNAYFPNSPNRVVLTGYPVLDAYKDPEYIIKDKLLKDIRHSFRKVVVWAPHWSIDGICSVTNTGNFDKYYKDFFRILDKFPEISFVFRPHPNLRRAVQNAGIMTESEFDAYVINWDQRQNGFSYLSEEYIDLFLISDAMILDSVGFVCDYLPSKRPALFLEKLNRSKFNTLASKVVNSYYSAFHFSEIENFLQLVVLEEKDPKKEERLTLIPDVLCCSQLSRVLIYEHIKSTVNPT